MKLVETIVRWIHRTRVEASHRAEREKCAQVAEEMIREMGRTAWSAADDFAPRNAERAAVILALQQCADRIRARGDETSSSQVRSS